MKKIIGKYIVVDRPKTFGCIVFERATHDKVGCIEGVSLSDLDEEMIEDLLFADIDN